MINAYFPLIYILTKDQNWYGEKAFQDVIMIKIIENIVEVFIYQYIDF